MRRWLKIDKPQLYIITMMWEKLRGGGNKTTFPILECFIMFFFLALIYFHVKLHSLRRLVQGDIETPKGTLGNNVRSLQPLHHRTVRTNIDFTNSVVSHWNHHEPR